MNVSTYFRCPEASWLGKERLSKKMVAFSGSKIYSMNKFYRIKSVQFQNKLWMLKGEKSKTVNIHESIIILTTTINWSDLQSSILVDHMGTPKGSYLSNTLMLLSLQNQPK